MIHIKAPYVGCELLKCPVINIIKVACGLLEKVKPVSVKISIQLKNMKLINTLIYLS